MTVSKLPTAETPLTDRQRKFANIYLEGLEKGWTNAQMAIRCGYKPKAAQVQASRLLTYANVQAEINRLRAEAAERNQVKIDDIIGKLASVMDANLADFVDWGSEIVEVREYEDDGEVRKVVSNTVQLYDKSELTRRQMYAVSEVKKTSDGVQLKLKDGIRAAELLAKILGHIPDRLNVTGEIQHTHSWGDLLRKLKEDGPPPEAVAPADPEEGETF